MKIVDHRIFMNRCFKLAAGGLGHVAPNPLVGALLINGNGEIISEGYHRKFGGPHAEVQALQGVSQNQIDAQCTLYVNLEPCSHHGKTPPCTDLIISRKIKNVVIANSDTNPLVNGEGIAKLQKAGVRVTTGIEAANGAHLNRRFFTFHNEKRPYIILKWAKNQNGFIAPVNDKRSKPSVSWISGEPSKILVHQWRSEEQAILTGKNTIENDDPLLTTRLVNGNNPLRLIIDPECELNNRYRVFNNDAGTVIFNYHKNTKQDHLSYVKINKGAGFMEEMLRWLYHQNIQSLIVEGGSITLGEFIKADLWDEARVFTGIVNFEKGIPAPKFECTPAFAGNVDNDRLEVFFKQTD